MTTMRTAFVSFLFCLPVAAQQPAALTALARNAVLSAVRGTPAPTVRSQTPPRPVFVTIERDGRVLGCRGGLEARTGSLEQEIVLAAQAAAIHDPRYRRLSHEDTRRFLVTVTIVDRLEPVADVSGLSPSDGLVLRSGTRCGVVLPWEGKDPVVRLQWAYRKAGVAEGSRVQLFRLKAERYRG